MDQSRENTCLDAVSTSEVFVIQHRLQLFDSFRGSTLGFDAGLRPGAEELQHLLMIPQHAHIVVPLLRSVDGSFDSISIIVDDEDDGFEAITDVGPDFLNGHLKASFSHDQDYSSRMLDLLCSDQGAETGPDRVSDGGPEDLG